MDDYDSSNMSRFSQSHLLEKHVPCQWMFNCLLGQVDQICQFRVFVPRPSLSSNPSQARSRTPQWSWMIEVDNRDGRGRAWDGSPSEERPGFHWSAVSPVVVTFLSPLGDESEKIQPRLEKESPRV